MFIFVVVIVLTIIWLIVQYNRLVFARNLVREAWSGIDVQLKRRYDLIPNLVETVKGYGTYEQTLLDDIIKLRSKTTGTETLQEKAGAENEISSALRTIFAAAEAYPDLKASRSFLELQKSLIDIEDQLQYARRYYNGTVRDYNTEIESFPGNLLAQLFKFEKEEFFEITLATEREAPEVKISHAAL